MTALRIISNLIGIADYIKLDRHCVCADPAAPNSMYAAMDYIRAVLPHADIIAEGVKSADHAQEISKEFPDVHYVQGLYLPDERKSFQTDFYNASLQHYGAVKGAVIKSGLDQQQFL